MTRSTLALATALLLAPGLATAETAFATYWANSGSLPPEYAWSVDVAITDSGAVTVKRCTGYETEGPACTTGTGTASAAQLEAIRQAVTDSGLLTSPAREAPPEEIPIGGGSTGGSVTMDGQTVTLMPFPHAEDIDRVHAVLTAIAAAIPQDLAESLIEGN